MRWITEFKDTHKGKTILLVGNGNNLHLTPPEEFDYPSIGMNEIHLYQGWLPTYWTAVDRNAWHSNINSVLVDIPKFIPHPRLSKWSGDNFYYFKNHQGLLWPKNGLHLWQEDLGTSQLIYGNSMHVAMKIAYYMGAQTILVIGMEHMLHRADKHFYGKSKKTSPDQPIKDWLDGYSILAEKLREHRVKLLNISEDTFVPSDVIPQDNWENWKKE